MEPAAMNITSTTVDAMDATATERGTNAMATPAPSTPGAAASPPSPSRPPYIPQFTAATQMILKRMKSESSSLSSALSAASAVARPDIMGSTSYEDVKKRLVLTMATSSSPLTMQMPVPPPRTTLLAPLEPAPKATSSANMSKIAHGGGTGPGRPTANRLAQLKAEASEGKMRKTKLGQMLRAGLKRKRSKTTELNADNSSASSLSELSESETPGDGEASLVPPTKTKSGRQVLKPATYNPAAMDASTKKRVHYGKRTAEQALCKKCTRMHSPATNQMVFCDGCNDGWHQACHEPPIDDGVVRDAKTAWFCVACLLKRERHITPKKKAPLAPEPKLRESWADRTVQQKRAYLLTQPQSELVGMIMRSLELHPDLPIFPGTRANPAGMVGVNGSKSKPSANGTPKKTASLHKEGSKDQSPDNMEEVDPLDPPWPKAGMGLYSRLPPEENDIDRLVDDGDYEAFSVIVYDEKGKKIEENGMRV